VTAPAEVRAVGQEGVSLPPSKEAAHRKRVNTYALPRCRRMVPPNRRPLAWVTFLSATLRLSLTAFTRAVHLDQFGPFADA
jgi:hypothetical protein